MAKFNHDGVRPASARATVTGSASESQGHIDNLPVKQFKVFAILRELVESETGEGSTTRTSS